MTSTTHDWESAYQQSNPAPWDIGRPQPALLALVERGVLTGEVLDAGCGTGEHALLLAARGERVTGVDLSETAIFSDEDRSATGGSSRGWSDRRSTSTRCSASPRHRPGWL